MYIRDTFASPNPSQAKIGTICKKVVDVYFESEDKFMTETEAYPDEDEDLTKTNVNVITEDNGELKKVVVLEAKRFPANRSNLWYKSLTSNAWTKPKKQLETYMLKARKKERWAYMMYGIVAVGDRVRFFKLRPNSTKLAAYVPPVQSPAEKKITSFSIHQDSLLIEKVLSGIADDIKRKRQ